MMLLAQTVLFAALQSAGGAANSEVAHFDALIKSGEFERARSLLEDYTRTQDSSWQAWYQLGYVDFRLHRLGESVKALSKSLVLNQNFASSHKILAFDLNILGRRDLAISELRKAIRLDPQSAESYYELGRIYYDEGSYLKAVENLENAERLNPAMVKVHHNLGLAYSAVGEKDKAVAEFEEGLRLNAQQKSPSAWPLIDYATYHNQQNEFARARDLLLEAIRISDRWDQAYDELSKAYRGLGQTERAIEALKQAIVLNPGKPEYHYVLSRLYSQINEPAQAKQELVEYGRVRKPNAGHAH